MPCPQVTVSPEAAKRLRNFDCWVFRDELIRTPQALPNGQAVELIDRHGAFLGYAFYSATAHIAARVISRDPAILIERELFAQRIASALERRAGLEGTNARRLVFSEADGLPGLIVDQYADHLVLQIRTAGLEPWRAVLVELLRDAVHPKGILERSDKEFREEEGLDPVTQVLAGSVPDRLLIEEDGLRFRVDPYHGHKTGFYLDQRDTRRTLRALIRPGERVADVFAYTGAFAVGVASRGAHAVCVERDEGSLALAKENAELNGVSGRLTFVAGDAFYWLEAKAASHERFDWVLLDPPSLAKTKGDALKGRQALHHLLVHALGMLKPEGTLALSVCTYHLLGLTEEILRIAAGERGLRLRLLALTLQAPDHPWILQIPATRYLMSWTARLDGSSAA